MREKGLVSQYFEHSQLLGISGLGERVCIAVLAKLLQTFDDLLVWSCQRLAYLSTSSKCHATVWTWEFWWLSGMSKQSRHVMACLKSHHSGGQYNRQISKRLSGAESDTDRSLWIIVNVTSVLTMTGTTVGRYMAHGPFLLREVTKSKSRLGCAKMVRACKEFVVCAMCSLLS